MIINIIYLNNIDNQYIAFNLNSFIMKKTLGGLVAMICLHTLCASAQSIGNDSRGKDIFDFYKTNAISVPITSADGSFKLNVSMPLLGNQPKQFYVGPERNKPYSLHYITDPISQKQVVAKQDSAYLTYQQSYGFNISLQVSNVKTDITHVATFHPSYSLSIGISQNVDLFNNWSQINTLGYFSPHPWSINIYGKMDNLMIYDTLSKVQVRKKPFTLGLTGEISIMPYNYWFISISGNIEHGNNIASLVNYQANTPTYTDPEAIALGDIVGKIGDLQHPNNYRLRISSPIILPAINWFKAIQPCIIPYYNYFGQFNGKSNNMFGFFANILGDKVYKKNSTIVSGAGIGVDWTHNSVWSHNIFISGSLDLYKVFSPRSDGGKQKIKS